MKRFTETNKWRDVWFRGLSGSAKLLWFYLLENCDNIGLVDLSYQLASADCGQKIDEKHLDELGDRVQHIGKGRYFIPKFINFQYGELSTACAPHRNILKLVAQHGLIKSGILYHYPSNRVSEIPVRVSDTLKEKEKEKDQDQEKDQEGARLEIYHKDSRTALHFLNEKSGRHFRETDSNLGFISARLSEHDVDIEGVKEMIARQCQRWLGTQQEEYLRPETLFNKTKFDGYYASRGVPVVPNPTQQSKPSTQNGIPLWRQIQILEEVISKHPANKDFIGSTSQTATEAAKADLKQKRDKLAALKAQQANDIQ